VNKELGRRDERERENWGRGRYNVTLGGYCLVVLRVAMTRGEYIRVGLGVGAKNWLIEVKQHCDGG
jgi:hypothetical protein